MRLVRSVCIILGLQNVDCDYVGLRGLAMT
jgi:hypothetical protein